MNRKGLWAGGLALILLAGLSYARLVCRPPNISGTAGHRLKSPVGDLAAFAYHRGAGKHQVDGLWALLHHPYLNVLRQLRPQLLLHDSLRVFKQPLVKLLVLKAPLYESALNLGAPSPTADAWVMVLSPFAVSLTTQERPRRLGLLPSRIGITGSIVLCSAQGLAQPR